MRLLPCSDLSELFVAGPLNGAWHLLRQGDVACLVDLVKPRVRSLFALGRFGTPQQLLWDTDDHDTLIGPWGIYASYVLDGRRFYPFRHDAHDFEGNRPTSMVADPDGGGLEMAGVATFTREGEPGPRIDLSLAVSAEALRIAVRLPEGASDGRIHCHWYPLYGTYDAGAGPQPVEYCEYGLSGTYEPHFRACLGSRLALRDRMARMPGLDLSVDGGDVELASGTDVERCRARFLRTDAHLAGAGGTLTIRLLPEPVAMAGAPHVRAGEQALRLAGTGVPAVTVDGDPAPVEADGSGWLARANLSSGRHRIEARSGDAHMVRTLEAHGDRLVDLRRMADAASAATWHSGPLKDVFPYNFYIHKLEAVPRSGLGFCAHATRAVPMVVAGGAVTGEERYFARARDICLATARLARERQDGTLTLPLGANLDGTPAYLNASRPSDQCLMVRALRYAARGLAWAGHEGEARELLDLAVRFGLSLRLMQQPDGSFYPRYHFESLEPNRDAEPMGTVNNWALQLWELAAFVDAWDAEAAAALRGIAQRHVEYLLFSRRPGMLVTSGGGEDSANNQDGLATGAGMLTLYHLATGEARWAEQARQMLTAASLTHCHPIDQPGWYFQPACPGTAPYYGLPDGLQCIGGMHDKTVVEAALFLYRHLGWQPALELAATIVSGILSELLQPNGAVCNVRSAVPNVTYSYLDTAEPHTWAAVGIYVCGSLLSTPRATGKGA